MTVPFLPTDDTPVALLPDGRVRALADLVWTGSRGDTVTVLAGTVSDLGTVPHVIRGLLPNDGPAARAFLVHDVLCDAVRAHRAAVDAGSYDPIAWQTLAFSAVDVDNVLRVILAELGVGPARWLYWEGVRLGALGSAARRAGWWHTAPLVALLALPCLVLVLPAAIGTAISRALLDLVDLLTLPWELRARRHRTYETRKARTQHAAHRMLTDLVDPPYTEGGWLPQTALACNTGPAEPIVRVDVDVMHPGHETWIRSESICGTRHPARITRIGRAAARQVHTWIRRGAR